MQTLKRIETDKAPRPVGPYAQAIICGNLVFTSGQIATSPQTNEFSGGDIAGQTRQVIENLKAVLELAGSGLEHVVRVTVYLADLNDFGKMNEVYGQYFTGKPARSTVAVKGLPKGALVEIDCIAAVPRKAAG
jgi:2-iminobutanoate/2-iminopropanoate deaminase